MRHDLITATQAHLLRRVLHLGPIADPIPPADLATMRELVVDDGGVPIELALSPCSTPFWSFRNGQSGFANREVSIAHGNSKGIITAVASWPGDAATSRDADG